MYEWSVQRVPANVAKLEGTLTELERAGFDIYKIETLPMTPGSSSRITFIFARREISQSSS